MAYSKGVTSKIILTTLSLFILTSLLSASFFRNTLSELSASIISQYKEQQNNHPTVFTLVQHTPDNRNCGLVTAGLVVKACSQVADAIGGNVYEDVNYDGTRTSNTEKGIEGVTVNLFGNSNELINSAITDTSGNYLFKSLMAANYRVEFILPPAISCWAKPSVAGIGNNTSVQFIAPGNCANLGISDPLSYCGTKPFLATTCFIGGEPTLGGSSGEGDVLVSYPYNNPTSTDINKLSLNKEIGTTWGLAYKKSSQDLFVGAMLKRHAGFGPLGIDGIYRVNISDPSVPVTEEWLKLSNIGVDAGTDPRAYQLPAESIGSSTDPSAFSTIGKKGIGDVDLSENNKILYVMNLNNNGSLVIIDVATKSLIKEVPINNPGCGADSDVRPWAINIHEGNIYVGLVCSGQAAGVNDLKYFVLKLDGNSFTQVFAGSLDYSKGFIYPNYNNIEVPGSDLCGKWEVWMDDFSDMHQVGFSATSPRWCRPQAMLSDIEFDTDGSMILAFMDRTGHQTGYNQFNTDGTELGNGYVGGDILRVHNNAGIFEIENAGTTSNGGGCGANGEGPGGGEYYCGEIVLGGLHLETSLGALAITGTDSLVALNVMDPVSIFSGGTVWLSNNSGTKMDSFELFNSHPFSGPIEEGTFGKAAGLGDLELICEPAPIEIGNLVWHDENGNGIQDPSENGMDNILIELIKAGNIIATTTTANGGHYYFSNEDVVSQNWVSPNIKVLANMDYTIRIKTDQFPWKKSPIFVQTMLDSTNYTYLRNNDGVINGEYVEVSLTTGSLGCMAHEYDFGAFPSLCLGNLVWEDVNNDGKINNGEQGIPDIKVMLCDVGKDGIKGNQDDNELGMQKTNASGNYLFTGLIAGDYYVKVNSDTYVAMLSSTGKGFDGIGPIPTYEPAPDPDNDLDDDDNGTQMGKIIMSNVVTLNYGQEPINDTDTDSYTNTTLDFGLFKSLSLGNKVWIDNNNNGIQDPEEKGIHNVEVTLFQPGPDNIKNTNDDITIAVTNTDFNGCYLFEKLYPGKFWVKLTNRIPNGSVSSDGNGQKYTGTGYYESGIDPNNNKDKEDNGTQMGAMVMSEVIDLFINDEPIDDKDTLNNTNTTVDFGLFPMNQIMIFDPCKCLGNESSPGAGDGQFSDQIVILSSRTGEVWSLKSSTGLYNPSSAAPPATPTAIPIGTIAKEDGIYNGLHKYILDIRHIDGIGYDACFTNGFSNLTVSNLCKFDASCIMNIVASPDGTPNPVLDTCVQNFIMGTNGINRVDTLNCCDNKSTFVDDGTIDGLYADNSPRTDQFTICAQNKWKILKYNFSEFDLALGDTLYVYDGRENTDSLIGKFSGTGVGQTGGWVASSCDPYLNNSGCLTFEFKTNGDNNKGKGWAGNFECSDRNIKLTPPNDLTAKIKCKEVYKIFAIKPAKVKADCATVLDTQFVRIYDAKRNLCKDTCIGGTETFNDTFALGTYLVIYKLKSDTTKSTQAILTVQGPALICNDEVNVPIGTACAVMLTPDDLLESTCDTIPDTLYYFITLKGVDKNGNEKVLATGGGKGGNYPMVTKDMIDHCGGSITATIEKRYYDGLNISFCNNGTQSLNCSVKVNISDSSAPWFTNTATSDTFKLCDIDLTQTALGLTPPKAVDNCDSVTVTFDGVTIIDDGGICDTTRANITWTATDECGNTTSMTQLIVFIRPDANDVVKAPNVILSCGVNEDADLYDFVKTGIPSIKVGQVKNGVLIPSDTISLDTAKYICGYILQKKDVRVASDCGIKVFRYWDILDWCKPDGGPTPLDTQFIELKDITAPIFTGNTLNNRILELPHGACTLDITKLENPAATDNCSTVSVRLDKVFRIEDGALWETPITDLDKLPCDSFQVRWVAEDACHEQKINDTITQIIIIDDVTKPSAVCTDELHLSLGRDEAKIHYSEIDGGSYDACGIIKYEISRDEVLWDDYVTFTCEDVHNHVTVYLRVTDGKGNQNTCWMLVTPEDKIAPICSDLEDAFGTCDEEHTGAFGASTDADNNGLIDDEWVDMTEKQIIFYNNKYGNPDCADNLTCDTLTIQQQYQLVEKNCGIINIIRRYRAIDWNGQGNVSAWATQNINIEYKADWTITLPADWKGACGDNVPDSEVLIENGKCDLMAVEVEEKVFTTIEDACLKVVRTFTIINWCNYSANDEAVVIARVENEHGLVTESQVITAEGFKKISKLQYIQVLKIKDDTAPIISLDETGNCIESADCQEVKRFAISATDCNDAATLLLNYSWTLSSEGSELVAGQGAFFDYPVVPKVIYDVRWTVSDNCGNTAWKTESYQFWDCKRPTPYCLNGVTIDLMKKVGTVDVWASDIERSSSDNCTPKDKLDFRIWHVSLGAPPTSLEQVQALPKVITFTCAYLGNQVVNLYVIDEENNWDFCVTYVIIQDNTNACEGIESPDGMALVSGTVMDWKQKTVEDVQVAVGQPQGIAPTDPTGLTEMATEEDGIYHFELAMAQDYTIRPQKDMQPLNGVSTFDVILISKHILGIQALDNPYQLIAADVNNSSTVTAFDMVQLRRLILSIDSEFKSNTSWRFVDADYQFISDNPLTENFPEVAQINNLSNDMIMDFVAIKVGDVNGNARPNSLIEAEVRNTADVFEITTEDKDLKAGESYSFTFSTTQMEQIQGYQFTLGYENLRIDKLIPELMGIENFGLHKMDKGYITTSWNQLAEPATRNPQLATPLFTIEFKTLHDGKLSEQLSILDRPTSIQAYNINGKLMDVKLTFTKPSAEKDFELYQNEPNPFKGAASIGFYLPGDSKISLTLTDEVGRLLRTIKEDRKAGEHKIDLSELDLPSGFIYYQLSSKFGVKAKKMLRLD